MLVGYWLMANRYSLAVAYWLLPTFCLAQGPAEGPIYLQIVPQKYSHDDPAIPNDVRGELRRAGPREALGADGTRWRAGLEGLVEIGPTGQKKIWTLREGLPILPITSVAVGPDGRVWLGTPDGAMCLQPAATAERRWLYFWGRRYLPDNDVAGIVARSGHAWMRTRTGVSRISFEKFDLEQKSAGFIKRLHECHDRYGLVADSRLLHPGDPVSCHPVSNDNDGLWTSLYIAAECFRFHATHSEGALANARRSLRALERLLSITGIPGFPARSFIRRGEGGDVDGEWHFTADGAWKWKGDTSNDELVGHFFAYSVAYDLLPADDAIDREAIRNAVDSIAGGLIQHGFRLVGYGGRVTRWGDYSPAYFKTPEGQQEAPGLSLILLSHLRAAYHVTGDQKFLDTYNEVVYKLGYLDHVMSIIDLLPKISSRDFNFSDEELAFLAFYPLLKYEDDPRLIRKYRLVLAAMWRRAESEHNPLWNYVYAVGAGARDYGAEDALETLERIPLDLTYWTVHNSQRRDLPLDPLPDRHGTKQSTRVIPPEERCMSKWNGNPFRLDCESGGQSEDDGTSFLLPYWLGRDSGLVPPLQRR